ncbi:Bug family tripartite tricarboxylate transporter substrate binding protein [Paenibacillus harenae]|uniref:Tricarboxylic transport membrane protein n=1 Tax=Paenibacillus harenae TaxID=306543 RepID=A0ABT9U5G5_PAEHA|nr:tripartite tricarboxylate transporter substrate-binding protein [Paenibacillus harenae]MDQ0063324.1 putative tricarboxylic transport membrane protein [Paenibacillus harenae]MDQ0114887.1 putative tricarboxylic transport membrane protein [Paenibacillus harenae]
MKPITNHWKTIVAAALVAVSLTACSTGSNGGSSNAADYPEKPFIVTAPSGAGGGWDKTARSLAKVLGETKLVDQTMTVENKPGGGGTVFMAEYVTKDKDDPYKLFVSSPPILINNLKKEGNSPYGYKDVTPLAQLTKDYGAIAVAADSKYNDLQALIDDIKADASKVTLAGGSAPGSMDHLISVLPAFKSGVDPKTVKYLSYDGGGEAIAALLGNNADAIGTDISSLGSYLKAGKIKILAVTSNERLGGDFKDVPTLKELGLDAEFTIWRGVFGPKGMTADQIAFWDKTLKALSENETWTKELQANDWASEYRNSADFAAFLGEQEAVVQEMLTALGMQK